MKTSQIVGWSLSVLVVLFMIGASASGKFLDWEGKEEMFSKFGYTIDGMKMIGVVEVVVALLTLIPRTSFIGAILTTAYLGGATEVHVHAGDPFYFPIIVGVVMWIGLGLRQPEIFRLAIGAPAPAQTGK
jgi:hypothetical protein